jgi:hypothetical protein
VTARTAPAPSFLRRHEASDSSDPDTLVGLACDANYWVRRQAISNPATPKWVIDLLVQAGADAQLRGRSRADPKMRPDDLRRLVECEPFAQTLVAEHPNATNEILAALAHSNDPRVRRAVADHSAVSGSSLAALCADRDEAVRCAAVVNPACPASARSLLRAAGADELLGGLAASTARIIEADVRRVAALGPWGLFLGARQPACPPELLNDAAADPDWRVRSALLDNPELPDGVLAVAAADLEALRPLSDPNAATGLLRALADDPRVEVRLSVARHPALDRSTAGTLAMDRFAEVRRTVARRGLVESVLMDLLLRAGSSSDLAELAEPDIGVTARELREIARVGWWGRQLVVRHPSTPPDALAQLLCDDDPKLREWAAAHPRSPADILELIFRAGGARDLQGVAEPDRTMTEEELLEVAALGPWGAWVVAWHPDAPEHLRGERDRYSAAD